MDTSKLIESMIKKVNLDYSLSNATLRSCMFATPCYQHHQATLGFKYVWI